MGPRTLLKYLVFMRFCVSKIFAYKRHVFLNLPRKFVIIVLILAQCPINKLTKITSILSRTKLYFRDGRCHCMYIWRCDETFLGDIATSNRVIFTQRQTNIGADDEVTSLRPETQRSIRVRIRTDNLRIEKAFKHPLQFLNIPP